MNKKAWKALVDALKPSGNVLQIGENAEVSVLIQACSPKLIKTWPDQLPKLGVFDVIVCCLEDVAGEKTNLALRKGQETVQMVKTAFPELSSIRYSDRDLEMLCEQMSHFDRQHLPSFLQELLTNGQISEPQYAKIGKKYHLELRAGMSKTFDATPHRLVECILECLKHMRKGSRFGCVLEKNSALYEDPRFFEQVLVNPHIDCRQRSAEGVEFIVLSAL